MKRAFLFGLIASAAGETIFVLARLTLKVLSPPEVLVDWVARIIPFDLFLLLVNTLGNSAKVLLVISLAVALIAAGGFGGMLWRWLKGRRAWWGLKGKWWAGLVAGLVLWVLAMTLVLPASGRGVFGTQIRPWPAAMALTWLVSCLVYSMLLVGLSSRREPLPGPQTAADVSRRKMVKRLAFIAGGLLVAGSMGVLWRLVSAARRNLLGSGEMPPEITPNDDFFTVSKNFIDPVVDAAPWQLEITGLVEHALVINYDRLKELPATTLFLTLECISNGIGGPAIGNAQWKGVPLRDLLSSAVVKDSARKAALYAADDYTDSITTGQALEADTLLAYEMNGVPLPHKHGFPVRLLIPGIYGLKNVKWLNKIELVDYDFKGFYQAGGWSDEARVETMSRIDIPRRLLEFKPGAPVTVGGIAFAGKRGVSHVEVSTDDGQTWSQAVVKAALSPYTWVLWVYDWIPPRDGEYYLKVRATDGQDKPQIVYPSSVPGGTIGYHRVVVTLTPAP